LPREIRDSVTEQWVRRLRGMGLEVRVLPGGHTAHATLPLGGAPFPSVAGPRHFSSVTFATVGSTRIKCVAPMPLFQLPLIDVGGALGADEFRTRLRRVWHEHQKALMATGRRLRSLGLDVKPEAEGALLSFPLGVEDTEARVRISGDYLVLPERGPREGIALAGPAWRLARRDVAWETASDAEIALTGQLERAPARLALGGGSPSNDTSSLDASALPSAVARPRTVALGGRQGPDRRILLVGGVLARDRELAEALRRAGIAVRVEMSADDALATFTRESVDGVLVDAHLGRQEGVDLVPQLRAVPGVVDLPVVVVDESPREALRAAARRAGAAGVLVHPIDSERTVPRLRRLLSERGRRRFGRVPTRLAVRLDGGQAAYTTSVGRLGMFVPTTEPPPDLQVVSLHLPELSRWIQAEAQATYRLDDAGGCGGGVGFRFRAFSGRDESAWIEYLSALDALG
jgi:two-component system chemotaxis response regulator CheY